MTTIYRLLSALMGGMFGTFFMLILYFFSASVLGNEAAPITEFILLFMIFLGSLGANLSVGAFLHIAQSDKYQTQGATLFHTLLLNLFIFLVAFPFYILGEQTSFVAIGQLVVSAAASALLFEFFAKGSKYQLTGIYGTFACLFLIFVILYSLPTEAFDGGMMLFILLPFTWFLLQLALTFVEYMYTLYYRATGEAILDPQKHMD